MKIKMWYKEAFCNRQPTWQWKHRNSFMRSTNGMMQMYRKEKKHEKQIFLPLKCQEKVKMH